MHAISSLEFLTLQDGGVRDVFQLWYNPRIGRALNFERRRRKLPLAFSISVLTIIGELLVLGFADAFPALGAYASALSLGSAAVLGATLTYFLLPIGAVHDADVRRVTKDCMNHVVAVVAQGYYHGGGIHPDFWMDASVHGETKHFAFPGSWHDKDALARLSQTIEGNDVVLELHHCGPATRHGDKAIAVYRYAVMHSRKKKKRMLSSV